MSLLTTEESQFSDVFDELDVYGEGTISASEYINGLDLDNLALSAKNSPGTLQMTTLLAGAVSKDPMFQTLMAESSETGGGAAPLPAQSPVQYDRDGGEADASYVALSSSQSPAPRYTP